MNVALLTHEAVNSEKFRIGFPGGWPYVKPVELGDSDKLPPELPSPPWVIVTAEELRQRLETLTPLVNAWVEPEQPEVTTRRQLIDEMKLELRKIENFVGNFNITEASIALKRLAKLLRIILEEERISLR